MSKKNTKRNSNGCCGKKDGSGKRNSCGKGRGNGNSGKDNCGNRKRDGSCSR